MKVVFIKSRNYRLKRKQLQKQNIDFLTLDADQINIHCSSAGVCSLLFDQQNVSEKKKFV